MEAPLLLPVSTSTRSPAATDDIITVDAAPAPPAPSSSSSPSTQSIVLRVVAVLTIACASLFAQHEASKGFGIDVAHAAAAAGAAGRRFDLFFVSNGRAERILHRASRGVERALFPDASFPRRHVRRVTVRLAAHNLTAGAGAAVDAPAPGEYVISLSPGLVTAPGAGAAVADAVRRAVARMWLWDGRGAAPAHVTDSMVEYLAAVDTNGVAATPLSEKEEEDGRQQQCSMSARFLRHLERQREGFVARLNRAMRDRWSDAAVDAALGAPARPACAAYRAALTASTGHVSTSDATRGSSAAM